jgi:hypothetical protein
MRQTLLDRLSALLSRLRKDVLLDLARTRHLDLVLALRRLGRSRTGEGLKLLGFSSYLGVPAMRLARELSR